MLSSHTLRSIHFRFMGPDAPVPRIVQRVLQAVWMPPQVCLDFCNTCIPFLDPQRLALLRNVGRMKKMSTLAIGAIINECVREMPDDACYLNIGTWYGYSLFAGMAGNADKKCIGVDSFEQFDQPRAAFLRRFGAWRSDNHVFFGMDWREYIAKKHVGKIGVLFYDADHAEDSQYASLLHCDPLIIDGGIVLVDDANWAGPRRGTERFLSEHENYEVLLDVATSCNGHPTYWNGLMVLRKGRLR